MKYAWFIYIGLLVTAGATRLVERIMMESGGFASRYLPLLLTITFAFGIYQCLQNKAVLSRWVWVFVYGLSIASAAGAFLFSLFLAFAVGSVSLVGIVILLITSLALLPAVYKLKGYAAKDNPIWKKL
ncbi:MAG: hypothetical protein MK214_08230 [Thalassotalea sp.]|nr:hypothetical protein [Thalassotalea sp.]